MIKELDSLNGYLDFINSVSSDVNFSDPHYLYDKNNLFNAFQRTDEKVFAVHEDNIITGVFNFLIIPNERYIEMINGLSKSDTAYEEMLSYLSEYYRDFQIDFVFNPNNHVLMQLLKQKKADFGTEQLKLRIVRDVQMESKLDIRIYDDKFRSQYLKVHNKDMYWTGERVLETTDKFRVLLAIKDEKVIGYLDITCCRDENEVYDLFIKKEYEWSGYEKALLSEAIRQNKPHGMMTVMDVDENRNIELFKSLGFAELKNQRSLDATYKL